MSHLGKLFHPLFDSAISSLKEKNNNFTIIIAQDFIMLLLLRAKHSLFHLCAERN